MKYLRAEQVLFIHARIIAETGGEHGVIDLGLLESAVGRPQGIFDGKDLYPGLFSKAAALLQSLVGNHPFLDGNNRTAIASVGLYLSVNCYELTASNRELESFVLRCAQGSETLQEITRWLRDNSEVKEKCDREA
jgi:death on curing protein